MESKDNFGYMCKDCADNQKQATQALMDMYWPKIEETLAAGKPVWVKADFYDSNDPQSPHEHMWVKCFMIEEAGSGEDVNQVTGERVIVMEPMLIGKMDNEPQLLDWIKFEDQVAIARSEIEDVMF